MTAADTLHVAPRLRARLERETVAESGLTIDAILGARFPTPDMASAAVGLLDTVPLSGAGESSVMSEGPKVSVSVTAGVVSLAAQDVNRLWKSQERRASKPFKQYWVNPETGEIHWPRKGEPSRVSEWSPRSRVRLMRRVASLDYRPMLRGGIPVMVTLTLPGEWLWLCRSADKAKAMLKRFRSRYEAAFGAAVGVWKLEFQRRGAPHFHVLLPAPARMTLGQFRSWVATNWTGSVFSRSVKRELLAEWWSTAEEFTFQWESNRAAHLKAGTAVDVREGARMRDPKRVAVYFLKHGLKTRDGKEYQHRVPAEWGGVSGRFWGVWNLDAPTSTGYLSVRDWVTLRRLIRRWASANGRKVMRGGRMQGGFVIVNDGPGFLSELSRALAVINE